jgi:hypothetical protein
VDRFDYPYVIQPVLAPPFLRTGVVEHPESSFAPEIQEHEGHPPVRRHAFSATEARLSSPVLHRLVEMLPGILTWAFITSPAWAALLVPRYFWPLVVAFDLFWLYTSANTFRLGFRGFRRMRRDIATDWHVRYHEKWRRGMAYIPWEAVRHVVIIPNYKELESKLMRCLDSMAAEPAARQIIVVLAMEDREPGAREKATYIERIYAGRFDAIFSTFHPADIAGEVRGKSSNEAWAARETERWLIERGGYKLDHLTITSCDADTIFHPAHFDALTCKFATDPNRYLRFWQAPIFYHNNTWEEPALLRVSSAISGVHMLGNLAKGNKMVFPQSTYHLSFKLAREVGYWDVDVIPEDWHMFLKCYYFTGGKTEVEPFFIPVGNDGVRARGFVRTLKEAYTQNRRHAWGVSDLPYAVIQGLQRSDMSPYRRVRRTWALASNHLVWSTHWSLLTLGWTLPLMLATIFHVGGPPSDMHTFGRLAIMATLFPYIGIIVLDHKLRPPQPADWPFWQRALSVAQWFLLPVTSLFFSTIPAVHAHTTLLFGKRMEYKVTEKV